MDKVVDYLVYEQSQVRSDRTNRRLWILCIILIVSLLGTNAGWLYYENQFTDISTTTIEAQQDGEGINFVNGGDFNYGSESKDNNN